MVEDHTDHVDTLFALSICNALPENADFSGWTRHHDQSCKHGQVDVLVQPELAAHFGDRSDRDSPMVTRSAFSLEVVAVLARWDSHLDLHVFWDVEAEVVCTISTSHEVDL